MNTQKQFVILNEAQRSEESRAYARNPHSWEILRSRCSLRMTVFLMSLILNSFFLLPSIARAVDPCNDPNLKDFGLRCTAQTGGLLPSGPENPNPTAAVAALGGKLAGYLLSFVGVIFFALTLYGGILWMTSRGDAEQVKKAQELIKSAIFGLVIVFLSYAVTNFVLTNLINTTQH